MLESVVPPKLPISEMARTPQVMRLAKMTYDERSPRFLRHLQELDHPSKSNWTTAERICSEMTATEKDYVSDITALVERFLDPFAAFADKYCKTTEELPAFTALRCAAHVILGVHKELVKLMEPPQQRRFFTFTNTTSSGSGPLEAVTRVTKAFASTIEYMKVYAIYCANYLLATEELKAHAKLLDAFTLAQADPDNSETFDAVSDLIKPVQRICRYSLLFRSLVKNATCPEEVELAEEALESVQRVSDLVNARVRDAENNVRLVSINDSIDNTKLSSKLELLRPGRKLLCEMPAAVQVIDRRTRLARVLHLHSARFDQKRSFQQHRDTSSVNSEMELLGANSENEREESALRDSLTSNGHERNKDRQRVILLSDALLMARRSNFHLRVRRHICLSCATVIEAQETDGDVDDPGTSSKSFALLASKSGRCNCHNLSPSTLKRPVKRRYSLSRSTSQLTVEGDSWDTPFPASPPQPKLHRNARQYIVHCESEQKKKEFIKLLRHAIAHNARSGEPPRSCVSIAATNLSVKLWQSIKQRDFSHTLSLGLLRRRANALPSDCSNEAVNGSTDESNSDEPLIHHHNESLLRSSRSALSGAA
ncbi:PH domain-like [Phytophthora cactorum]|nr:PH domain-like [Phytophthora cactorum]